MKESAGLVGVGCGCIILNDKNEVLLVKRSKNSKTEPGMWSRPGGTVEFGETTQQALTREIKEELGIDIEVLQFLEYTDHIIKNEKKHFIALGFLGKIKSGIPKNREPDKHDEIKWFPLDKLPDKLTSYTRNAIDVFIKSRQSQARDYWSYIE